MNENSNSLLLDFSSEFSNNSIINGGGLKKKSIKPKSLQSILKSKSTNDENIAPLLKNKEELNLNNDDKKNIIISDNVNIDNNNKKDLMEIIANASIQSDSIAWISSSLHTLNYNINDTDLEKLNGSPILKVLQGLLTERSHLEQQNIRLCDESVVLNNSKMLLQKDKERDVNQINILKDDLNASNNRLAILTLEQRELRSHWLTEKTDMEGRLFQMLAVQTQTQGSMRKKEKEYERLQNQMAKLVKDSNRGSKASNMVISKPLDKNLSQTKTTLSTLKEAEIVAAHTKISFLENENKNINSAFNNLTDTLNELKVEFARNLSIIESQRNNEIKKVKNLELELLSNKNNLPATPVLKNLALLNAESKEKIDNVCLSEYEIEANLLGSVRKEKENNNILTPVAIGSITKKFLDGTPGAISVNWVVEQANTEIKKLRNRADLLELRDRTDGEDGINKQLSYSNNDLKYDNIKSQLIEALAVIHEQDRLIHEALLGRLPGYDHSLYDKPSSDPLNFWEEEDNDDNNNGNNNCFVVNKEEKSDVIVNQVNNNGVAINESDIDSIFDQSLPPPSPATYELVKGWFNLTEI